MSDELKPCPFCGAHLPHMWSLTLDGKEHSIKCTECPGRAVFKSSTREQAIAAWNRRTDTDHPAPASTGREITLKELTELARNTVITEAEAQAQMDRLAVFGQPAPASTGREPIYQVQFIGQGSAWHDASEAAYHTFVEKRRRIVYAQPAPATGGDLDVEAERREFEVWAGDRWEWREIQMRNGDAYLPISLNAAWRAWTERAARSAAQGAARDSAPKWKTETCIECRGQGVKRTPTGRSVRKCSACNGNGEVLAPSNNSPAGAKEQG